MDKKKNEKKYVCEVCDFSTFKKTDYNRHILTIKHKNAFLDKKENEENENQKLYTCICGKSYKHQSSLSKHKKTCKNKNPDETLISLFKIQQEQNNKIIENQQELQQKHIDLIGFIFKRLDNIEERIKNLENK